MLKDSKCIFNSTVFVYTNPELKWLDSAISLSTNEENNEAIFDASVSYPSVIATLCFYVSLSVCTSVFEVY